MKIVLTRSFNQDLNEIKEYLEDKTETGFANIKMQVFRNIKQIENFPEIGTKIVDREIYKFIVSKYDYKIFYCLEKEEIQILRIIHDKRNFKI